ncbi:MAG: glycosyltransferase [Candidatus Daviesbacteria bacterium]|nr:glycosyltransferase [Candidatus Daviesbacteria bacterium]
MKILILAMDCADYQGKSHELLVAEELVKMGNQITLVAERIPFGYDVHVPENITFHVMNINGDLTEEQYNLLMQEKQDICFASSFPGAKHVNYIAKKTSSKSVSQCLDVPIFRLRFDHWRKQWEENVIELAKSDKIIANIKITKELLCQLSKTDISKKIDIVYYGIASDNADRIPEQEKDDYIVWVSGIRWYKNLEFLLFSMRCMDNPPKLKVIGIGDKTEWETNNIPFRLIQLANHLNLDVEFLGGLGDDQKFEIIKKARLGVMCDISVSIATMFCLESVYCGTPCITGDFPVCRDRYGDTVIYVGDIYNTKAWADQIEEVLSEISHYTDITRSKKQWILENRSFRSQAQELMKIFTEMIT